MSIAVVRGKGDRVGVVRDATVEKDLRREVGICWDYRVVVSDSYLSPFVGNETRAGDLEIAAARQRIIGDAILPPLKRRPAA